MGYKKVSCTFVNGKMVYYNQFADQEFAIVDGVLIDYNGDTPNVIIPEGVTSIGAMAFESSRIERVCIPNTVQAINPRAFKDCHKLKSISIPEGVTAIVDASFMHCWELTRVDLPHSLKSIGEAAFWECTKLTEIKIPNQVERIGDSAFLGCFELESISIPDGLQEIGKGCFENCEKLKRIVLPESVKKIGDEAIAKQPKKYVRIDGKEICYLPTAKQYASQFDKKASFEPRENAFVSVKISEKCDSDVMKMNPHTAIRILKVLVLWDERLWMDYARYADDKELKILFAKMVKLKKAKKNKKDNANDGVLLANIRGALLLNEHKAARAYFEQIGLLQEYEKKH